MRTGSRKKKSMKNERAVQSGEYICYCTAVLLFHPGLVIEGQWKRPGLDTSDCRPLLDKENKNTIVFSVLETTRNDSRRTFVQCQETSSGNIVSVCSFDFCMFSGK